MKHRPQIPLLAAAMLGLLAGVWAGLVRLGWDLPHLTGTLAAAHGPLMLAGFLGTLIGLERAVALGYRWAYGAPLASALGVLALLAGLPQRVAPLLMTLGALGLVAVFVVIVRRLPALFTATMLVGGVAWVTGNGLWLAGRPVHRFVFWWIGFLVLTIAGERREMSRLVPLSASARAGFWGAVALFLAGLVLSGTTAGVGERLAGAGMVALAAWLLRYDIARRTVRHTGLTRFIAVCMLSGFAWLGVSGLLALLFGQVVGGARYDAVLHTLFLGFAFAMIFGHAPIILPAVLKTRMAFLPAFYVHLGLLHLSLLLRVLGDLADWLTVRRWGGMLNVIALLLFLANSARAVRAAARGERAGTAH